MVSLLPTPSVVFSGALLISTGTVLVAYIKAQKTIHELVTKLEAARQRQRDDERELTQRSALDSLKDEFVSTVSHELRTPLTSIRGALGLLSSGVLGTVDAKAQNLLRIALTNTERLIRLINDILDLERMDSGRAVLQVRRCSLPDLIHQATETMSAMADAANIKLAITPSASLVLPSVFFDGDSDRILQVLTNLLSNAIKFSPAASTVTIDVETPPEALIFRICDQGRGIPEDQLESIFERFKQVEYSDSRHRGGTGLGLAICRSIVQQHGGTIWAQRNPTRGVSICVRLPRLQRTYDVPVPGIQRAEPALDSPVLVCDDDDAHRSLIVEQLRGRGHNVLEAATKEQAIEIAQSRPLQSPVQAILIDLHMSGMKGWELLKSLTTNSSTANVPIVVMSVQTPTVGLETATKEARKLETAGPGNGMAPTLPEDRLFADLGRALDSERGPGHVLLVEDDQDLASVVMAGFDKTDVTVSHAPTLQQAMVLCREHKPDLIILDLTLPDGDGFSLVEWLRTRPDLRSLPLIVYSGRKVSEEERTKLRLGPTRFLTKARVQTPDVEQLVLTMVHHDRGGNNGGYLRMPEPPNGSAGFSAA